MKEPNVAAARERPATSVLSLPAVAALASVDPPLPWVLLDAALRIRALGSAAARELRLDAAQVLGRSWFDLFPDVAARDVQTAALLENGRELVELPRFTVAFGESAPRHFSLVLRPVHAADDDAAALLGFATEVTVQVDAEQALRISEQRFRAIVQHSRDLVIVCARDGRIQFASSALQSVAGLRPEQRVGGSVFERLHPDDAARARASIGRLAQDASRGVTTRLELRLAASDGGWRWIECTAANLLEHPAVNGIVLNCRDVTDRKQAEAALAEADARLDTALRTSRTAYWSIDTTTDRVTMSPHFFALTGIDRSQWDADRHPWYSRTHPDDYPVVNRAYQDCLTGLREFYECEYRLRTPDGWMWLHDRGCVAQRDAEGRPLVIAGTSQDAGWRKRMEETLRESAQNERRRLNDDLHDGLGQELSGIQFMLAGIASQLRRDGSALADEIDLTLALIRGALTTTRSISRGLEPANPKSGGLRAALQQLAADLSASLGAAIRCDLPTQPLPAVADAVADNLFRMAREALTDAGQNRGARNIVLDLRETDRALALTIADDGAGPVADGAGSPGMAERVLAYRARAIGAELRFDRDPGGGTRVLIRYPLTAWQDPAAG